MQQRTHRRHARYPNPQGPGVSLVQVQDILLAEPAAANLAITIIGTVEEDGVKHITDIHVSSDICRKSAYLQTLFTASDDKSEITLGDTTSNKEGTLVWLAHLQGLTQQRMKELGLYDISLLGVWYAVYLWELHQDDKVKENLQTWFNAWYETTMAGMIISS